ncbi:hypothetical protein LTR64_000057 [Lithohypha guttulata]|uniref:uncharacterized protein n=1 Tax=Lithohypha guttulata TaxID=1690604 RepID=UPI002DE027E7|nr:hypothetical protein LTR51_007419 [Lithohypha guttulata]
MAAAATSQSIQERLRVRNLSRYYCALPQRQDNSDGTVFSRDHVSRSAAAGISTPCLSTDGALTSFAQLAALKLKCQRSYISMIDDRYQYIIAEATSSISLFDSDDHDVDDQLVVGVAPLPLDAGVCPRTIAAFTGTEKIEFTEPNNVAQRSHVLIEDLLQEGVTKNSPVLAALPPLLRYYLEVPLLSPTGFVIGSICVVDPKTRPTTPKDIKKLQEVANVVVSHLGSSRIREDHRRAERLLEGLSHFIRGQESMSDWSMESNERDNIPSIVPTEPSLKSLQLSDSTEQGPASPTVPAISSRATSGTVKSSNPLYTLQHRSGTRNSATTPMSSVDPLAPTESLFPHRTDADVEVGFDPMDEQPSRDRAEAATSATLKIRQTFSRASNLLREGMDLDATCFLEVPQNERFRSGKARGIMPKRVKGTKHESTTPSESETQTDELSDGSPQGSRSSSSQSSGVLCHRLGFATRTNSSLAGTATTIPYLTITAELLSVLSTKYPEGHIFHFDQYGCVSSGDEPDNRPRNTKSKLKSRSSKASSTLFEMFPAARSLVFCPLYDNEQQQTYAAFLGFTCDAHRALQPHELVYVSGFANSIMCEVMRLEALAVDKAKSDFISSISHELRSPLHGILACTQLLSEAEIYPKQKEFITMIDSCGRSLLDVMDHLLDHAKINRFTKSKVKRDDTKARTGNRGTKPETHSLVTEVNLLSIVEDTTASMGAGSNQMLQPKRWSPSGMPSPSGVQGNTLKLTVPTILHIEPSKTWLFDTEVGAWRRIIMNLVGNSLKYTQAGHIDIAFSVSERPRKPGKFYADLKITDTGQGISESYLRHRLYTPFAQENNLSQGTGLGLSMVHQIVSSLKGTMEVNSEVGIGTEIIVSIPLTATENDSESTSYTASEALRAETVQLVRGRTFAFAGFNDLPPIDEQPTGILDPRAKALLSVRTSFASLLTEWFELQQTDESDCDICVVEERTLENNLSKYDHAGKNLLVVGIDGRGLEDKVQNARFVSALPPIGPGRLASLLRHLVTEPLASNSNRSSSRQTLPPSKLPEDQAQSVTYDSTESDRRPSSALSRSSSAAANTEVSSTPHVTQKDTTTENLAIPSKKNVILLVDDNDINLRILVACVKRLKLTDTEYETAANGKEALDKYITLHRAGRKIALILMDLSMPVMDGFQATREIRRYEREQNLKTKKEKSYIAAITGLASGKAQDEVENSGFDLYLRKPVDVKVVRGLLMEKQNRDESHDE